MRRLNQVPRIGASDLDYPNGRVVNSEPAQGGDPAVRGTAVVDELYGDLIQLVQKLIIDANITPNGLPDNVTNGYQILEALNAKILQTVDESDQFAELASNNLFTQLNTESFSRITHDGNASDIVRIGNNQSVVYDLGDITNTNINGVMLDGSNDVPIGTRFTIVFSNAGANVTLRAAASGLSGFIFVLNGFAGSTIEIPEAQDASFVFKMLDSDPDFGNKKVILIESAPTVLQGLLAEKPDRDDVIIKGGGDIYTPSAGTDPANLTTVLDHVRISNAGGLTLGSDVTSQFNQYYYRYGMMFVSMTFRVTANAAANKIIATWPSGLPTARFWRWGAANRETQNNEGQTMWIDAGTRTVRTLDNIDEDVDYTFGTIIPLNEV